MRRFPLTAATTLPIAYHNAEEILPAPEGVTLHRVPRAWRERFPEATAARACQAAGVELRFRAATRTITLELRAETNIGYAPTVALYHGYRSVGLATLPALRWEGQITLMDRQDDIPDALDAPWRILCPYGAETTLKAFSLSDRAALLPPQTERKVRWLAHGDSITQGAHALHPGLTYVHLVADELGWEGLNLGFGGSAWGDAAVAEYIAARQDWDILSIAIGTNTYGSSRESAAAFGARYEEFLNIIRAAHPNKPILCISPLWRRQDGPPETPNRCGDTPRAYREAIHQVVLQRNRRDPRLVLLDGMQLIGNARGLTVDQLHPDAHGMIRIAQQVAPALWGLHNP